MKKIVFSLTLPLICNFSNLLAYNYKFFITTEYQKLNDTLDVFNIKKQELGNTLSKYASIGDMDGYKLSTSYFINKNFATNFLIQKQNIQYGSGTLHNTKIGISFDYYFGFFRKSFISIGFSSNKANDIVYTNIDLLNSLGKKISGRFELIYNNNKYYIYEPTTGHYQILNDKPVLTTSNLKDNSINLKFSYKINTFSYDLVPFINFKYSKIYSKVYANEELVQKAKDQGYDLDINLDRDEKAVDVGFDFIYKKSKYISDIKYYYTKIFRDSSLDYINYNHTLDISIGKMMNKKTLLYLSGKLFYRQFNSKIPYLYNKYSQTTFDHKYGYVTIGVKYNLK